MTGATALCQGLMEHQEKLVALVSKARYSPQEMAAGATDLINEAAANKITGEGSATRIPTWWTSTRT
jgi:iron uptake system EfeUOB component EfeO/EfeM